MKIQAPQKFALACRELGINEVWCIDFEFGSDTGQNPEPRCMVAREFFSNAEVSLWADQLRLPGSVSFLSRPDVLVVAYYASAECSCFLALNQSLPKYILDLFVEFRNMTNGKCLPSGSGLVGALVALGLGALANGGKSEMRALALRGGPYTADEREALTAYCRTDVDALVEIINKIGDSIDLPRALIRGGYMKAVAAMETNGIPIDLESLSKLQRYWQDIKDRVVAEIDKDFSVYEGTIFKRQRFNSYLLRNKIAWPRNPTSGHPLLDDETFKDMAKAYPEFGALRELRATVSQLRLNRLAIGRDGRNRTMLSPFQARTSRNQPSNSEYIFGLTSWLRSLIKPRPGFALAYLDWEQQEFGIAAALSGDAAMKAAYRSGDPYLEFARQAGAVPSNATKISHKKQRDQFKACVLAVQYGMGHFSLSSRIGDTPSHALELLGLHRKTYPDFWTWSDAAIDHAILKGRLTTVFGWQIHVKSDVNPRFLRNFPMQANGAEMLRLACSKAIDAGIMVCGPIHDALLIEAPIELIDQKVAETQELMAEASRIVLDGFELRSDVKIVRFPDRYMDDRGQTMWETVWRLIGELDN